MNKIAKFGGVVYLLFLSLMLLHPNPWSLFGFFREKINEVSRFSLLHFAVFVFLGMVAESVRAPFSRKGILVIGLTYACVIELIQPLTGRHFEWNDFIQNILGFLVGVSAFSILFSLWHCPK